MARWGWAAFLVTALAGALGYPPGVAGGEAVRRLSADQLSNAPRVVVVDVRQAFHWESSETQIAGAFREDPGEVKAWAGKYEAAQPVVVYCS